MDNLFYDGKIDSFQNENRFLSNFYPSVISWEGMIYPTVEHAYQASKTHVKAEKIKIAGIHFPGAAKRAGRNLTIRPDWEDVKVEIMAELVDFKFRFSDLREKLLETGDALLVEGNQHGDKFWGVCDGVGKNQLGIILMNLREELRNEVRYERKGIVGTKGQ
jgi:N-glycosidase YbiA